MSTDSDLRKWEAAKRRLRRKFPCECRVVIRLKPRGSVFNDKGESCWGVCYGTGKSWVIHVERLQDIDLSINFLEHEYAHALAGDGRKHHPQRWVRHYWRIYTDGHEP